MRPSNTAHYEKALRRAADWLLIAPVSIRVIGFSHDPETETLEIQITSESFDSVCRFWVWRHDPERSRRVIEFHEVRIFDYYPSSVPCTCGGSAERRHDL